VSLKASLGNMKLRWSMVVVVVVKTLSFVKFGASWASGRPGMVKIHFWSGWRQEWEIRMAFWGVFGSKISVL